MIHFSLSAIGYLILFCSSIHATEENLVGVYSNKEQGFGTVTIVLGKNGSGDLMHSVGRSPIWGWVYDAKESIVTITGPLGENDRKQSITLLYDKAKQTLAFEKNANSKPLIRINEKELDAYLSLFDVTASAQVIELAQKEALTRGFGKDSFHVLSLNPSHEALAKQLKEQGFDDTKQGDELVQIQKNNRAYTLQYRKKDDEWLLIHAHDTK
jgi:hypothetical protein